MQDLAVKHSSNGALHVSAFKPWPVFGAEEKEAVQRVLESGKVNYWTGTEGRQFEEEFADAAQCKYAVAVANGSVALELALRSLGIGAGDEVVVPSRTFVATASSVVLVGATPIFADVDIDSQNITAETIREVITPRTKAIIVVHLAGWPCEMDAIMDLAVEHNLKVIEDCAQAQGATYRGQPVGSIGHAGCFSFCQDKIMTTGGEGGMLTTNSPDVWQRAWPYKDHGKNYEAAYAPSLTPGFKWVHDDVGTNWRLTEMQAAIGRVGLRKVPEWTSLRRRNASYLTERLRFVPALHASLPPDHVEHAYYKYYVFVRSEYLKEGWNRDRIITEVERLGIPCFSGSCSEVYLEKAFVKAGLQPEGRKKAAYQLGQTSLMFLVHPTLTESNMRDTCEAVEYVLHLASVH